MNKYKYERVWLQEIMTENKMLKLSISHATRCIDDYVYVLTVYKSQNSRQYIYIRFFWIVITHCK